MTRFSKWVFACYMMSLTILYLISKFNHFFLYVYWTEMGTVLFLQMTNMLFRKPIDNFTKYKDSISYETEKIRFVYMYFGFPITLLFPEYFRQIRKDSYYERRLKQIESTMNFYEEHKTPLPEEIKNEWTVCNRYLKLKKLKTKQEEI